MLKSREWPSYFPYHICCSFIWLGS